MSRPAVMRATSTARDRVVGTVVTAFAADPAFRFFFPDPGSFVDQATIFAGHLFDKRVDRGTIWIVEGGMSVAMWDDPADAPQDDEPALPADSLARLTTYHATVQDAMPAEKFWYLGILATHPDGRGRRLGRMVMEPALDLAAEAGLPAYLETTNPNNVDFYRRAGWATSATLQVESVEIWVMNWLGKQDARSP